MKNKKRKLGFSVLDGILLVLFAFCILSTVFYTQIQNFFGSEKKEEIEYTFLIESVSDFAKNYPKEGEEIFCSEDFVSLGKIIKISETKKSYLNKADSEDEIKVVNLTCQGRVMAEKTDLGYAVGEKRIKPGATFSVQTDSATFVMVVTMANTFGE